VIVPEGGRGKEKREKGQSKLKEEKPMPQERIGSTMKRSKAVSDRLDLATDALCKTVRMSRKDFDKLLGGDK